MMLALQSNQTNVIFSPLSLNSVLSILQLGSKAGSETEDELKSVLGQVINKERLKRLNRKFIKQLDSTGKDKSLIIIFVQVSSSLSHYILSKIMTYILSFQFRGN